MAGRGLNSWACYWADLQLFIFVFGPNFLDQHMEVLHEYLTLNLWNILIECCIGHLSFAP